MYSFLAFCAIFGVVRSLPIGEDEIRIAKSVLVADWDTAQYQNLPLAEDTIVVYENNPNAPPNYVVGQLRNYDEPMVDNRLVNNLNNLVYVDQPDNVALVDTVVLIDDEAAIGNRVPIVGRVAVVDNVPINENIQFLDNSPKYVPDPNQRPVIYRVDANTNGNDRLRVLPYQNLLRRRRQTIRLPSFNLPINVLP